MLERDGYIVPSLTEFADAVNNDIGNIVVVGTLILKNVRRRLLTIRQGQTVLVYQLRLMTSSRIRGIIMRSHITGTRR